MQRVGPGSAPQPVAVLAGLLRLLSYLDGALFVRIAVAMDAIAQALVARRPSTTLAFLGTPTDCHLVPATARAAAGACVHACIVHAWLPPWRPPL